MAADIGGPAYPEQGLSRDGAPSFEFEPGMTLLDWFAGQALIHIGGLFAAQEGVIPPDKFVRTVAEKTYELAAAMIAEKRRRESE